MFGTSREGLNLHQPTQQPEGTQEAAPGAVDEQAGDEHSGREQYDPQGKVEREKLERVNLDTQTISSRMTSMAAMGSTSWCFTRTVVRSVRNEETGLGFRPPGMRKPKTNSKTSTPPVRKASRSRGDGQSGQGLVQIPAKYRIFRVSRGRYAQRGRAVPVCGVEAMHYPQMCGAGSTPAQSTPRNPREPSCLACPRHHAVATTPPEWVSRQCQPSAAHAAFAPRLQARPPEFLTFEATYAFTFVTAYDSLPSLRWHCR